MYRRGVPVFVVLVLLLAFEVTGEEGNIDRRSGLFTRPRPEPAPVFSIAEPRRDVLFEPPPRITVFFSEAQGLIPQSLELWIDGVEFTESLRFWVDRAWLDLPADSLSEGSHSIEASILDAAGNPNPIHFDFDLMAPLDYIWPFDYATPNVVSNLLEDYQKFSVWKDAYWHHGLDIRADAHSDCRAVVGGYVAYVGCYADCKAQQYNVTVLGDDNFLWQYSHLEQDSIQDWTVGDRVEQGDILGTVVPWPVSMNGATYNHLHLNAVKLEGFDPFGWRALAEDPGETPPAVPAPLSPGFKWYNPLLFLELAGDLDTEAPQFGDLYPNAPDLLFLENETNLAFASDEDLPPVLNGNVDICCHMMDTRDVIGNLGGQPYTLGLYEIGYSVEPLDNDCNKGWLPYTKLGPFDVVPGGYDKEIQNLLLLDVFQENVVHEAQDYATVFNWEEQGFFYNVTNTFYGQINGSQGYWNTDGQTVQGPLFPDGDYRITVSGKDFAGNVTSKSVDVVVENGLEAGGFCPNQITRFVLQGLRLTASDGSFVSTLPVPMLIDFGPVNEGSTTALIDSSSWSPWYFDFPAQGVRLAIGVLDGQEVEVEYVPYLGDVILEIPAEAQALPLVPGAPPPVFDPQAPSTQPVDLRLSTRLARHPWDGGALLGSRQIFDQLQFGLVVGESIVVPGLSERVLTTEPGSISSWVVETP